MEDKRLFDTRKLVLLALFTAVVAVLQFLGAFIRFGPFSVSLVLMPIVIGAALMGVYAGGWLGLMFGVVVLLSGDATAFLVISPAATIFVVLLKGLLAGLAAGAVYKLAAGRGRTFAAIAAAVACPVVNTGVFLAGTYAFFLPTVTQWGEAAGFANTAAFVFIGLISMNFVFELALNLVLSPVIVRLVQFRQEFMETKKKLIN